MRILGVFLVAVAALSWSLSPAAHAQGSPAANLSTRPEFREPVKLGSVEGVLEVRLTARQGTAKLDTVEKPVSNFLLFSYELIRGTSSDGRKSGESLYPAPTLQVFPGERLIVHFGNDLSGLTIRDFYSPQYISKDATVPMYPTQLTSSPLNLHTHGIHVSPKGNADNVMLHIPASMSNTYVYDIPKNMPHGAYWYHSHLHTLTAAHVYTGMVGLLAIGRTDGNLPFVTEKNIPVRNFLLQYNFVHARADGLSQLNNPYWPQFVSTIIPPKDDELAKGTYRPILAPVNFRETSKGSRYTTVWYEGPLSIRNQRGRFQYIPSNMQRFTAESGRPEHDLPENFGLPDYQRDVQFTVNGQFQPTINSKAGQTEIWVLANVSDIAYMNVQLTETATGRHPRIAIVGQDGNPYPAVHFPPTDGGTRLLIPPASRFAIAVTIPASGELILEMPERGGGAKTMVAPGIVYTNDGTENPPAMLGSLSVMPSSISYADGFFVFPTQVLAKAIPSSQRGETIPLEEGQPLGAFTSFVELSGAVPDVKREIRITGGFLNDLVTNSDAKSFVYAFDGAAFPNMPIIQSRLGSVEEWSFVNLNNDEHPIHVHVNDFQVIEYFDPTTGLRTGPDKWGVDNANVPAPTMLIDEKVVQPGRLSIRTRFDDYIGLFVMHCHRLNHEDNGLMALVNVIPAVSSYAVSVTGGSGRSTKVRVHDGRDNRLLAEVTPFDGHQNAVSVAMGDIDGDGILDLVVGAGKDHSPEIVVYSGAQASDGRYFAAELNRFLAFEHDARGGVSVAAAQIDGTIVDNVIVGSGPGRSSEVRVFSRQTSNPGAAPRVFSTFSPYAQSAAGINVAAGFVDFGSGRNSIVTAPRSGPNAEVKVFVFRLLKPLASATAGIASPAPEISATFAPFAADYKGGLSVATGWLAGHLGGAKRIIVSQSEDKGAVKIFSSGSALDGGPSMYLHNPEHHGHGATFAEIAAFIPFQDSPGARVASTSTTSGAHLLVGGLEGGTSKVAKYDFERNGKDGKTLNPIRLHEVAVESGEAMPDLGGD